MTCLIDNLVARAQRRGKRLEVMVRYLRMRYGIRIEPNALRRRLEQQRAHEPA